MDLCAQAKWFEHIVDLNTYDCTDFCVLVTGLPPDAGYHEVGCTQSLVLNLSRYLISWYF